MEYCDKCNMEYEVQELEYEGQDGCLCPIYRIMMREGHYNSVPPDWIASEWDEPLYCDDCHSSCMYGSPCACDDAEAVAVPV